MRKNDPAAMLMLLCSMVIYGSIGIFRRYIPLPSAVLACFRGIAGSLFLFLAAKLRKKPLRNHLSRKTILWLCISGAVMGFNWILLFEAYNYTTVATATLCYYMQPTIVVLLSPLLFRERITLRKGLCALVSVAGMVLVSGVIGSGPQGPDPAKGILLGLSAAVLYAVVVIINKKTSGVDAYEKTIIQLMASAASLLPYLAFTRQEIRTELTPFSIAMLVIVGVVHTGVAYALYFGSIDRLQAQTVAVFSYLDPITALILSAAVLGERLQVTGIIGALMIIGAAVVCAFGDRDEQAVRSSGAAPG